MILCGIPQLAPFPKTVLNSIQILLFLTLAKVSGLDASMQKAKNRLRATTA